MEAFLVSHTYLSVVLLLYKFLFSLSCNLFCSTTVHNFPLKENIQERYIYFLAWNPCAIHTIVGKIFWICGGLDTFFRLLTWAEWIFMCFVAGVVDVLCGLWILQNFIWVFQRNLPPIKTDFIACVERHFSFWNS